MLLTRPPLVGVVSRLTAESTFAPTIPAALGVPAWVVLAAFVLAAGAWLLVVRKGPSRAEWIAAGVALGTIGILAWLAGSLAGWRWGLSITGPTRSLVETAVTVDVGRADWGTFMLVGVAVGALVAARARGPLRWRRAPPTELLRRTGGGMLMGAGGTLAAGCNIGNALTGLSVLAVNSAIATLSMIAGLAAAVAVAGLLRAAPPGR